MLKIDFGWGLSFASLAASVRATGAEAVTLGVVKFGAARAGERMTNKHLGEIVILYLPKVCEICACSFGRGEWAVGSQRQGRDSSAGGGMLLAHVALGVGKPGV